MMMIDNLLKPKMQQVLSSNSYQKHNVFFMFEFYPYWNLILWTPRFNSVFMALFVSCWCISSLNVQFVIGRAFPLLLLLFSEIKENSCQITRHQFLYVLILIFVPMTECKEVFHLMSMDRKFQGPSSDMKKKFTNSQ